MKSVCVIVLTVLAACATATFDGSEPLSIEFGQDVYVTDDYLRSAPGAHCGSPSFAPGGTQIRGPLPDGSWFRVFAIDSASGGPTTVVLERGWAGHDPQLTMRLDSEEGIVRLVDRDRRDAWGINHAWAGWMRALGARVLALQCASSLR